MYTFYSQDTQRKIDWKTNIRRAKPFQYKCLGHCEKSLCCNAVHDNYMSWDNAKQVEV